tara:strand:+ start:1007 stop:2374 length:1368 start_codon:yes stop_codon:yes gene_type:complete
MFKVLFFFLFLTCLIGLSVWLTDNPGSVTIYWLGYKIQTYFGVLLFALLGLLMSILLFARIVRVICKSPREFFNARRRRREAEGYKALTFGMAAVAAGDKDEATKFSKQADKLLGNPRITRLLSAQTAALNGDGEAASKFFNTLSNDKETRFVGLVGLIRQAQHSGNTTVVHKLTKEAYELRPGSAFIVETLFDLQIANGSWEEANKTLADSVRRKVKPESLVKKSRAVVLSALAQSKKLEGNEKEAILASESALNYDKEFVPAALIRTGLISDVKSQRKAVSLIESFCKRKPHPKILEAYVKLWQNEEDLQKYQRLQNLLDHKVVDDEVMLFMAQSALNAHLWREARSKIELIKEKKVTVSYCLLMSELEKLEMHDDNLSKSWLEKASRALPDKTWACNSCGAVALEWSATCGNCHAFDTIIWKEPPRVEQLHTVLFSKGEEQQAQIIENEKIG